VCINSRIIQSVDVRTHPLLQYVFPPKPPKPANRLDAEYSSDTDDGSDSDEARNAILPRSRPRSTQTQKTSHSFSTRSPVSEESGPISEENRFLNVRGLLHHGLQYITLDDTQMSALSPSSKATFPGVESAHATKARRGSRLPNMTMNFDLKTLNQHLALRAAEILACSESMWEWVLEYQAEAEARKARRSVVRRVKSGSVDLLLQPSLSSGKNSSDSVRDSILELAREDFNALLSNFEL
jgi:hypothetical protein